MTHVLDPQKKCSLKVSHGMNGKIANDWPIQKVVADLWRQNPDRGMGIRNYGSYNVHAKKHVHC